MLPKMCKTCQEEGAREDRRGAARVRTPRCDETSWAGIRDADFLDAFFDEKRRRLPKARWKSEVRATTYQREIVRTLFRIFRKHYQALSKG